MRKQLIISDYDYNLELTALTNENTGILNRPSPSALHSIIIDLDYSSIDEMVKDIEKTLFTETFHQMISANKEMPGWFDIEQKSIHLARGASGEAFEFIVSVGAGIASGLATHMLTNLAQKIFKREIVDEPDARRRARYELVTITRRPLKHFELQQSKEGTNKYLYLFKETSGNRKHVITIHKERGIIEYSVFDNLTDIELFN